MIDRFDLASAMDRAGRYSEAAAVLDDLLAEARREGPGSDIVGEALALRASLLRYEGRLQAAAALLDEAERLDVVGPLTLAALEVERACIALELGDLDTADARANAAFEAAQSAEAGSDRELAHARALVALAQCRRVRGDFVEAGDLLRDAISALGTLASAETPDGPASSELAHALDERGVLGKFSGAFEESEAAYDRVRDILGTGWGPDHPDIASVHHNLGGLAHARGDLAAAELHARRSVELHDRSLGPDHLATVLDRSALATILDSLGRSDEAAVILRDCADYLETRLGPEHRELAVVLNNLAAIAVRAGRLDEAEATYERAIAIKERSLGPGSPSLAISLSNLATVKRRQGRPAEARPLYERAIALLVASTGEDHPHVEVMKRNLAQIRVALPDMSEE